MDSMLYLAPVMGIVALLFAFYLASKVGKQDAGTDRMKEIAAAISDGAHAFLMSEYKILVIFVIVLFVLGPPPPPVWPPPHAPEWSGIWRSRRGNPGYARLPGARCARQISR